MIPFGTSGRDVAYSVGHPPIGGILGGSASKESYRRKGTHLFRSFTFCGSQDNKQNLIVMVGLLFI
jgi:hypothetical protein